MFSAESIGGKDVQSAESTDGKDAKRGVRGEDAVGAASDGAAASPPRRRCYLETWLGGCTLLVSAARVA